ncbi:MAG: ATP-binding cassette domain-containing protein [Rhodoferax sp.]|nr:ATP-binding cassette domain-containing protein [Rhodoferax sp.]MBP8183939.1 ATP-binding cassette domain-containing protein [Rhodoferax sp.]
MRAIQIIQEEHGKLWRLATTINTVADEIDAGGALTPDFFEAVFDYVEGFVDQSHHPKEDKYLFRLLRQRTHQADQLLTQLEDNHRDGPDELKRLRQSLALARQGEQSQFTTALRSFTEGLKKHIRTEERELIPLAKSVLTPADWDEINTAFLDNKDPLFGEHAKEEYRELYHRIATLAPESVGLGGQGSGELKAAVPLQADLLLKVRSLESSYGRIKALKGIDFEVNRGETVALVGANGAGKTTFLRALSGVQPMDVGTLQFDGRDISKLRSDLRMRAGICHSPEGRQVFGPLSIEDNLRLGAYTQPKHQVAGDLEKIFTMFPVLKEKRLLPAGTLSGGQQQMLAIGRALMGRPRLLLLDEPSMGLAPLLVEEVFNVIKTLKAEGMTIILAEQNAFAALAIADRGYVMETGTITLSGTGQELISNEQVRAAYLGM